MTSRVRLNMLIGWALAVAAVLSVASAPAVAEQTDRSIEESSEQVETAAETAEESARDATTNTSEVGASVEVAGQQVGEAVDAARNSAADRPTGLPARERTIPGGALVIVGYLVLWGMLGGYLLWVVWRQKRLRGELDELEAKIDELYDRSEPAGSPGRGDS